LLHQVGDLFELDVKLRCQKVNILGGSTRAVKENAEALVVAAKKIGLEVNAAKTKYMVMSRDQNAGRTHSMKIDNSSFERMSLTL